MNIRARADLEAMARAARQGRYHRPLDLTAPWAHDLRTEAHRRARRADTVTAAVLAVALAALAVWLTVEVLAMGVEAFAATLGRGSPL